MIILTCYSSSPTFSSLKTDVQSKQVSPFDEMYKNMFSFEVTGDVQVPAVGKHLKMFSYERLHVSTFELTSCGSFHKRLRQLLTAFFFTDICEHHSDL